MILESTKIFEHDKSRDITHFVSHTYRKINIIQTTTYTQNPCKTNPQKQKNYRHRPFKKE